MLRSTLNGWEIAHTGVGELRDESFNFIDTQTEKMFSIQLAAGITPSRKAGNL